MGKTKEMFNDQREWALRMGDEAYQALPPEVRKQWVISERAYYPKEHQELWDTDERYQALYRAYSKAKKELDAYKHERRYPNEPV